MFVHPFNVFETKLSSDNIHITQWIDVALDMDDFSVIKCANDLKDSIDSANVG